MDKSLLAEYESACKLIDETEKDLKKLVEASENVLQDSVVGSNPVFPYEPRKFHIEGIGGYVSTEEISQFRDILKRRRAAAKKLRLEVEAWVNTIPPRMQRIVRLRYFEGDTWEKVSAKMGFTSPNAARMALDRFLKDDCGKNTEKILENA